MNDFADFEIDQFIEIPDELNFNDPLISGMDFRHEENSVPNVFFGNPMGYTMFSSSERSSDSASTSSSASDEQTHNINVQVEEVVNYIASDIHSERRMNRFAPILPSAELIRHTPIIDQSESRKMKNRIHAQNSRDRKKKKEESILQELDRLRNENIVLKSENNKLRQKIRDLSTNVTHTNPDFEISQPGFEKQPAKTFHPKAMVIASTMVVFCIIVLLSPDSTPGLKYEFKNTSEDLAVLNEPEVKRIHRFVADRILDKPSINISNIQKPGCHTKHLNVSELTKSNNFLQNNKNRTNNLSKLAKIINHKNDSLLISKVATNTNLTKTGKIN